MNTWRGSRIPEASCPVSVYSALSMDTEPASCTYRARVCLAVESRRPTPAARLFFPTPLAILSKMHVLMIHTD